MRFWSVAAAALVSLAAGCTTLQAPGSTGEQGSGFTYIPVDPLPVSVGPGAGCQVTGTPPNAVLKPGSTYAGLLDSLPDNAVRIAIKEYDLKGNLSYVGSGLGVEGRRYQVILDYINADSTNIRFFIKTRRADVPGPKLLDPYEKRPLEFLVVERLAPNVDLSGVPVSRAPDKDGVQDSVVVIPVYVGVGLRLTADLQVIRGKLNLSSLGAIAAGVEAGNASGSLVVQTLGVTGKQVSTSLPLPSELNQTTVQTAILSLGSIKAIIFDAENTRTTPRVIGIYLPIREGNEDLVNRIVSELARDGIPWPRPCAAPKT